MDKRRGPAKALSLSLSLSLFASAHPRNRVLITTRKNTHYTTYIRQVLKRKSKRACRFRVSPKSSTTNPKCRCALGFRLNLHPQLETLSAQTGVLPSGLSQACPRRQHHAQACRILLLFSSQPFSCRHRRFPWRSSRRRCPGDARMRVCGCVSKCKCMYVCVCARAHAYARVHYIFVVYTYIHASICVHINMCTQT